MAFIESQLLSCISFNFESQQTWLTTKVEMYSGIIGRNAERAQPLMRYKAPYDAVGDTDYATLIAAFNACLGGLHSFRFKDWADYTATTVTIGTAVGGAGETMQLSKPYAFGSQTLTRTIKKPVAGTVNLFEDGVAMASTVDTTTGIVTFTSTAAKVITATFEYDVAVMFANDTLAFNLFDRSVYSTDIDLIEDKSA